MSYEHNREKLFVPFFHDLPSWIKNQFHQVEIGISRSSKSMEFSTIGSFLFIIDCISCFLTLKVCHSILKEFQQTEIDKFPLKTETENFISGTKLTLI